MGAIRHPVNGEITMRFVATCGAGLEGLIGDEVKGWGGDTIAQGVGSVSWSGALESGYRACLWSPFASRVLLVIATVNAESSDELYEQAATVQWENHLDIKRTFAVDCTLAPGAPFRHSKFMALRVKDAIADYFRGREGRRPDVRVVRPDVRINVHAAADNTVLSVDLSGESLHRRGYRSAGGVAPLKETLAAAVVKLSGWSGDEAFVDPMCGSGTLLIEAALMFGDSAPGLGRTYFGMTGWRGHEEALWSRLVSEAIEREENGQKKTWPPLIGYDADPRAITSARANIRRAGLDERLHVKRGELFSLQSPQKSGCLVCNPPYGERLSEKETVRYLYRSLGNRLRDAFGGWKVGLFTSHPDYADMVGVKWHENHRLYNGPLSCRLFVGCTEHQPRSRFIWSIASGGIDGDGADFANRLRKNLKSALPWSAREGIECFRVYDRDIPEYNVSIDLYGKWVHIQEFAPPSSIDEAVAAKRFNMVLTGVKTVMGVGRERVFIKTRKKQRGKSQYQRKGKGSGRMHEVREGRCAFLVNFTDYLDTGLFLDHRITRLRVGQEVKGLNFLNLFGYTASATVHAALGGAASTTTVDLSKTYLHWAEMNFALNGMFSDRHQLIRADCLDWLKKDRGMYDVILVDPPTFSNTRTKARVFDVQKQHGQLICLAMARLRKTGLLLFSTNFRSFIIDQSLVKLFNCRNISQNTRPEDFKRHKRVHQCWEIRHENDEIGSSTVASAS